MPDERAAIRHAHDAYQRLVELGWREVASAPCDRSPLLLIEPGSTGIHRGFRDAERRFWIAEAHDLWPSRPMLYRPAARPTEEG